MILSSAYPGAPAWSPVTPSSIPPVAGSMVIDVPSPPSPPLGYFTQPQPLGGSLTDGSTIGLLLGTMLVGFATFTLFAKRGR